MDDNIPHVSFSLEKDGVTSGSYALDIYVDVEKDAFTDVYAGSEDVFPGLVVDHDARGAIISLEIFDVMGRTGLARSADPEEYMRRHVSWAWIAVDRVLVVFLHESERRQVIGSPLSSTTDDRVRVGIAAHDGGSLRRLEISRK